MLPLIRRAGAAIHGACPQIGGTMLAVKAHDAERHPGPFRIPRVDAESAGIIVAVAFVVLGVVGLPIGKWFLLGAVLFGALVALLLRVMRHE